MNSMAGLPHIVARMGDTLRKEVERQLLVDLGHYRGLASDGLSIDWSNPCQEGHCTEALGGMLEEMSDIAVRDRNGDIVAEGWLDFVHGGGDLPLHVFWLFLDLVDNGVTKPVKKDLTIPLHVWNSLSDASKYALTVERGYDSRWHADPKVAALKRALANEGTLGRGTD